MRLFVQRDGIEFGSSETGDTGADPPYICFNWCSLKRVTDSNCIGPDFFHLSTGRSKKINGCSCTALWNSSPERIAQPPPPTFCHRTDSKLLLWALPRVRGHSTAAHSWVTTCHSYWCSALFSYRTKVHPGNNSETIKSFDTVIPHLSAPGPHPHINRSHKIWSRTAVSSMI